MRRKTIFSLVILIFLSISCFAEEKLQTFVSGAYDVYLKDMGLFYTSTIRDDIFFDKDNFLIDQYGWKRIISNDLPFGYFDYDTRTYIGYDSPYIIDGSNYAIIIELLS